MEETHPAVDFIPPLKLRIRGYFACGLPGSVPDGFVEMRDDGKNGDSVAEDGIYTYVFNIYKREKMFFEIFFDDGNSYRKNGSSLLTQVITKELSRVVGEKHAGPKIRFIPRTDTKIVIDKAMFTAAFND